MKKVKFSFLFLVFLFCLLTQPALAQFAKGGEGKYLILGTTSKTVGYMGPWVGKRKGFFAAEGLNVDIPILKSSTTGIQALIGGQTPFDPASPAPTNRPSSIGGRHYYRGDLYARCGEKI